MNQTLSSNSIVTNQKRKATDENIVAKDDPVQDLAFQTSQPDQCNLTEAVEEIVARHTLAMRDEIRNFLTSVPREKLTIGFLPSSPEDDIEAPSATFFI